MSNYKLEAGGHVLCYRHHPLGGKKLLAHVQRLEKRLARLKAESDCLARYAIVANDIVWHIRSNQAARNAIPRYLMAQWKEAEQKDIIQP